MSLEWKQSFPIFFMIFFHIFKNYTNIIEVHQNETGFCSRHHAQSSIQTNDFSIEHFVVDNVFNQGSKFITIAKT